MVTTEKTIDLSNAIQSMRLSQPKNDKRGTTTSPWMISQRTENSSKRFARSPRQPLNKDIAVITSHTDLQVDEQEEEQEKYDQKFITILANGSPQPDNSNRQSDPKDETLRKISDTEVSVIKSNLQESSQRKRDMEMIPENRISTHE